VRFGRQINADPVTGLNLAAGEDDSHHACLANEIPVGIAIEDGREQSGLEVLDLAAGIAQSGDLDDGRTPDSQPRAGRKREDIEPPRRDILAEITGLDMESLRREFIEELRVHQVYLPQVRLARIARDPRTVLHRGPGVGVSFGAEPFEEPDSLVHSLAETMLAVDAHGDDDRSPCLVFIAHSR
jgi:hypothetical protein